MGISNILTIADVAREIEMVMAAPLLRLLAIIARLQRRLKAAAMTVAALAGRTSESTEAGKVMITRFDYVSYRLKRYSGYYGDIPPITNAYPCA